MKVMAYFLGEKNHLSFLVRVGLMVGLVAREKLCLIEFAR